METIFTLGDLPEGASRVNLDDLYERTKEVNLNTLATFNSVLNRIHLKIKLMSRSQRTEQFCWYVIPEMIIGVPNYNHTMCTAYIIDQLNENGFIVKYTSPNLLFVSWKHWIPSYVRHEIKKNFCIVKVWMTNCEHQNPQVVTSDVKNLIPQGCLFKKHTPEF
jgi:hypothetical protein